LVPDDGALIEYRVDADAAPGNVLPALTRLLIGLERHRQAAESQNETHGSVPTIRLDVPTP
jgi:hypothetical protein